MTAGELKKSADVLDEWLNTLSPGWHRRTIAIGREIASMMRVDARRRIDELTKMGKAAEVK